LRVQGKLRLKARGRHPPFGHNLHPLFRLHADTRNLTLPGHARQHIPVILKIKVQMPRPRHHDAPHFAAHPHPAQFAFDELFDRARDLAHGKFGRVAARDRIVE